MKKKCSNNRRLSLGCTRYHGKRFGMKIFFFKQLQNNTECSFYFLHRECDMQTNSITKQNIPSIFFFSRCILLCLLENFFLECNTFHPRPNYLSVYNYKILFLKWIVVATCAQCTCI